MAIRNMAATEGAATGGSNRGAVIEMGSGGNSLSMVCFLGGDYSSNSRFPARRLRSTLKSALSHDFAAEYLNCDRHS